MENLQLLFNELNKVYDSNLTKIRIGNANDGGYIALQEICNGHNSVYSFGVGDDIGFEVDFIRKFPLSKIECFDPTISSFPILPEGFPLEKITFKKSSPKEILGIPDNSLLKIDIEGDEWELINSSDLFTSKRITKFSQILIELHLLSVEPLKTLSPYFNCLYQKTADINNNKLFEFYYRAIKSLNRFFYIFHIHPNNSLPKITIGEYEFPPLLEVGFVRKDLVSCIYDTHTNFPIIGLDSPNKVDREDIFNFYPLGGKIDE